MARKLFLVAVAVLTIPALAGCGTSSKSSSATSTTAAAAASGPTQNVSISLTDFAITPMTINVQAGSITFNAKNDGHSVHNFEVKLTDNAKSIGGTKDLDPGESGSATVTLVKGTYIAYCSEPGHESLGMKGSIVVS